MISVSAINVGIDVGSTTTKICALDARTHALLHTSYQRHGARQAESVRAALTLIANTFPQASVRLALTGSGAAPLARALDVPFLQEVVATPAPSKSSIRAPAAPSSSAVKTRR